MDVAARSFLALPALMEAYVGTHFQGQESLLPILVRVLAHIGGQRRREQFEKLKREAC
ncbi:MAG TPA: hypothetical protein VGZ29_15290 [Terriglobia bacterium]|nr:hypothetical protein [Terriglobia bacterium]